MFLFVYPHTLLISFTCSILCPPPSPAPMNLEKMHTVIEKWGYAKVKGESTVHLSIFQCDSTISTVLLILHTSMKAPSEMSCCWLSIDRHRVWARINICRVNHMCWKYWGKAKNIVKKLFDTQPISPPVGGFWRMSSCRWMSFVIVTLTQPVLLRILANLSCSLTVFLLNDVCSMAGPRRVSRNRAMCVPTMIMNMFARLEIDS